ncbi:MAG TPA: methyltransferase domain-containing protein [Candidatus Lokiarchaeia archaeon]|nr:methyltransferase domain-containing protein [Candidatus Lokiarchaeia archaeon]
MSSKTAKGKQAKHAKLAAKPAAKIATLGPITDLGKYVTRDWWKKIFDAYYLKTDGDVINDPKITETEITMFTDILNLPKEAKVLDLCCGQGRHSLELARRGFTEVYGLDQSHYLIQQAKETAKKEALDVRFQKGDARKLPYSVDFFDQVLILGNSFGYFETLNDDLKVLKEVTRVLKPGAKIMLDLADGEFLKTNYQPRSWEWIDKQYFVVRERSLSPDGRLLSREIITDVNKGVVDDRFYGERLYTQDSITKLLQEAGFSDIEFHGNFKPDSQRNQDLGMMERRFIITAGLDKAWTPVKAKKAEFEETHVVVIFGDPKYKDPVKPGATFDSDDFNTINQLKGALQEIKEYKFSYMNNHATLFHDLEKIKNNIHIVFNLCDEGYYNNPRYELHVPAILEILKIPYTGGNPQCLAYCYDKSLVRGVAAEMGVPVADAYFIKPEDQIYDLNIGFPVIVKPNFGDSSYGITAKSVCNNIEELDAAITNLRTNIGYEKPILVEEYLTGKDLTVGIIGNPGHCITVLPIIEEDYSELPDGLPKICGYEAKWDMSPDNPYGVLKSIPAELTEETQKLIEESSLKLFERMECRDYARFDWRLDAKGNPHMLEVNPNPGWCWDGHLSKMCKIAGISYPEMIKMIIEAGEDRYHGAKTDYNPECVTDASKLMDEEYKMVNNAGKKS